MRSSWLNKTLLRLKALIHRRQLERDLEDEIGFHLEMRAQKNRTQGGGFCEASSAARRQFGNVGLTKEKAREMWTFASLESWWLDLRYARRTLVSNPGFAIVAVLAIALGVGVNAGIFTILNGVALKLLPVPSPERLINIDQIFHGSRMHRNVHGEPTLVSYSEYLSYRDKNHVFSGLIAYEPFLQATLPGDPPRVLFGTLASCNYFEVLRIVPAYGRGFVKSDCAAPGTNPVVVISDDLWRSSFGADPRVLGKLIRLNRSPFVVVGVTPPGFTGTEPVPSSFWVPVTMQESVEPGTELNALRDNDLSWLALLGRLRPGISLSAARADLSVIARQMDQRHPNGVTSLVLRQATFLGRQEEHAFVLGVSGIVLTATGLVLLIACANVASLLLARASARQKEIALRLSIGGSRCRLIRQLLTESLLLAFLGGVLGSVLAFWSFSAISRFVLAHLPHNFPPLALNLEPDWRVIIYALVLTIVTGAAFGLTPALQATRLDLSTSLKQDASATTSASRRGGTLRSTLVGIQVAVCMILLLASALLMRGLHAAQTVDPGFRMSNIASLAFDLRSQAYDDKRAAAFQNQLIAKLAALPGVTAVAEALHAPLDHNHSLTEFSVPGTPGEFNLEFNHVSPAFFSMLEIPFLLGRNFTDAESRNGTDVAIVNETAARTLWPNADPLGKILKTYSRRDLVIVGVARDMQISRLGQPSKPYIYLTAGPQQQIRVQLLVDHTAPFLQIEAAIRQTVRLLDPGLPVDLAPLGDNLEIWRTPSRIVAYLSASLGALALILSITGVYGVASYASNCRIREIGIRRALGAGSRDVLGLLLRHIMRPVIIGSLLGMAGCAAVSWVLSAMLFGLRPVDPLTFALVFAFLLAVALIASYLPARRALRTDPVAALRHE
jgi:putative ABC transport system permease protein